MVQCEYCKKRRSQWKELSFHQFPKEKLLKLQWVRNMGRIDWMPKYWHTLCSEHFSKNCIDFQNVKAKLRQGSVPTIFAHNKKNEAVSQQVVEIENNSAKKQKSVDPADASPMKNARSLSIDCSQHLQRGDNVLLTDHEFITRKGLQISLEAFQHDHNYAACLEVALRQLNSAANKIKKLSMEKKRTNEQNRRGKKKLVKMQAIIRKVREQQKLLEEDLTESNTVLKAIRSILLAI